MANDSVPLLRWGVRWDNRVGASQRERTTLSILASSESPKLTTFRAIQDHPNDDQRDQHSKNPSSSVQSLRIHQQLGDLSGSYLWLVSVASLLKMDLTNSSTTGGALARPATEYPSVFGKIKFFHDYPFALPTFVTGSIGMIATITSAIGIKEVLHYPHFLSSSPWPFNSTIRS